jgi:serine beta-lactamase-like protein LACTB, mitochondrial
MTRRRAEAAFAVLFSTALVLVGGAAVYFVSTISVHTDPAAVPSTAAEAQAEGYSGPVEESRRLARALLVEENLPGLSLAVAVDGEIVWAEGFGWADIEARAPVTPVTRFRLGALSKPLTAAGVALLHDRGRIDLDAPVQRYVAAYPEKQWTVTTRQLMGDVAGVHRIRGDNNDAMPGRHCASLDEALTLFAGEPLMFRPGSEYRYSIYGWILVSAVVEGAAGEPFPAFMTRELFEPLGMERTVLEKADGVPEGTTSFYGPRTAMRTELGVEEVSPAHYSCLAGAGAFLSTPSDLVRFGSAIQKPGLLKADTIALLQTPLRLESGVFSEYALGWKVESVQLAGASVRLQAHRGSPAGGSISLMLFPDLGLVIAAASNVTHAKGVASLGLKVAETFAGQGSVRGGPR